jgi:hypothetical protein
MQAAGSCLVAWQGLASKTAFAGLTVPRKPVLQVPGKVVEAALLDRQAPGPVHYRALDLK